jgi:hypothetical protein
MVNHCVRTRTRLLLPRRCQLPLLPPVLPIGSTFRRLLDSLARMSLLVGAGSRVAEYRANRFGQPPFNYSVPLLGVSPTRRGQRVYLDYIVKPSLKDGVSTQNFR